MVQVEPPESRGDEAKPGIRQRPPASARELGPLSESQARHLARCEAAVAEPFLGVHTPAGILPGLFQLDGSAHSTAEIRRAAVELLSGLEHAERERIGFGLDDDAWRRWSNIHRFVMRHGLLLEELDDSSLERAFAVLSSTLSASGYSLARDIMQLNGVLGEMAGRPQEFGDLLYWMSLFGTPGEDEPWGWQIDGHHLIVNCLVLDRQIVTTPMFMGSEPVASPDGAIRVFAAEEEAGLAMYRSLGGRERDRAHLGDELPGELVASAFNDNAEIDYAGVRASELSDRQQETLFDLIGVYVSRSRDEFAAAKMREVESHLGETHFSWIGGAGEDDAFYYRVHSPVVLIEFDHQAGVVFDNDEPSRNHIHTVVRTPNGNDYGKDLLRQHLVRHPHVGGPRA